MSKSVDVEIFASDQELDKSYDAVITFKAVCNVSSFIGVAKRSTNKDLIKLYMLKILVQKDILSDEVVDDAFNESNYIFYKDLQIEEYLLNAVIDYAEHRSYDYFNYGKAVRRLIKYQSMYKCIIKKLNLLICSFIILKCAEKIKISVLTLRELTQLKKIYHKLVKNI